MATAFANDLLYLVQFEIRRFLDASEEVVELPKFYRRGRRGCAEVAEDLCIAISGFSRQVHNWFSASSAKPQRPLR
jgi:hypothetical protein